MSWNYRIVKYADETGYGLHEVHYGPDGEVSSITENPCCFVGDTPEEVRSSLLVAKMDAKKGPVDEPMNRNERIRFLLGAIKANLIFGTPEKLICEIVVDLEREIFELAETEQSGTIAPWLATGEETACYKCGRPSVYNEKSKRWVGSCEECMPF